MRFMQLKFGWVLACVCALFCLTQISQSDTRTLPEDRGSVRLYQLLLKLKTTARIMHTTAHPDDEDGGMMTLEARGKGATVTLFSINRGEGGQNKFGAESSDELGILRTMELLQADKYYGVDQRFSHVIDFGFSKTADETFNKWKGHEPALGDMVRAIRVFRPDVLTSRFQGNKNDGHGNHEASGVLSREAFRAAGDPTRFPEQIKEGLLPWQPKKFYVDGFRIDQDYTVKLDTGTYSPFLGMSYIQYALEGLAHQTSQGTGGIRVPPGHRYTYYKLADSVLPAKAADAKEDDFMDGIDTSLPALAERIGSEEKKVSFLRPALVSLAKHIEEASRLFSMRDPSPCATPLLAGLDETKKLIRQVEESPLSASDKAILLPSLNTKREQFEDAANEALGIFFEVSADPPGPPPQQTFFFRMEQTFSMATPGQTFAVTARLYNRGTMPVTPDSIRLIMPENWVSSVVKEEKPVLNPGDNATVQFKITVPENAKYTRPYWSRRDTQEENRYTLSDPNLQTLPLPPYPLHAMASFSAAGGRSETSTVVKVKFVDPTSGQSERPLVVGPALSVLMESPVVVVSSTGKSSSRIDVSVRSNLQAPVRATLRLETPSGWKVEPESIPVELDHDGDISSYSFQITPQNLHEGAYEVKAKAEYNGKEYAEGFKLISRPDLDSFYAYHPATQKVQAVDIKLPAGLKVGYIMGAGDEIASVLRGVGLNISIITPQELANGDLGRYDTIVVGIRAYDVRTDVREQNRRLLEYANQGGTLIVQYNQTVGIFNEGRYTPYPATLSTARVSVEEMPVEVLSPDSSIFSYPNKIEARDFDRWVQERGLYFMSQWDEHFKPLLSSHDPGEAPQKGGMLLAPYGKGLYIYSGYAFFRQLPAGVPGAIRLFVNLLSAGHTSGPVSRSGTQ
ncbi:MAG TPA: NEW3 domain-containing protein [Candidatus Angelobacter sp.]|nr:NEW3 domain-containing protein [Candidatus Angelobacter sp.]